MLSFKNTVKLKIRPIRSNPVNFFWLVIRSGPGPVPAKMIPIWSGSSSVRYFDPVAHCFFVIVISLMEHSRFVYYTYTILFNKSLSRAEEGSTSFFNIVIYPPQLYPPFLRLCTPTHQHYTHPSPEYLPLPTDTIPLPLILYPTHQDLCPPFS